MPNSHYINNHVNEALTSGNPAISVDTKKKELIGDFKNGGQEWRPKGSPEEVRVHNFVIPELGRANRWAGSAIPWLKAC
jgi:hypothetical protein